MYRQSKLDGDDMAEVALAKAPFGPGFTMDQVQAADTLEVWCSGLTDAGPELTRFDLKKAGRLVATATLYGY